MVVCTDTTLLCSYYVSIDEKTKKIIINDALCVYTNCYSSPLLAGVPCRDVTVEDSNVVKCVTGPQPSRSTYYPGMDVARK